MDLTATRELFAAAYHVGGCGGINEFLGAGIFTPHAIIMFLDLKGPGGKIGHHHWLETETKSHIRVEVGL